MISDHTYYLAAQRRVSGPAANYMRLLPVDKDPGRYDGVSLFLKDGKQEGFSVVLGEVNSLEKMP